MEEEPDKVQNPKGWLRRAIEEDYGAPDGYLSKEDRERLAAEEAERAEEEERQAATAEERNNAFQKEKQAERAAASPQFTRGVWNDGGRPCRLGAGSGGAQVHGDAGDRIVGARPGNVTNPATALSCSVRGARRPGAGCSIRGRRRSLLAH